MLALIVVPWERLSRKDVMVAGNVVLIAPRQTKAATRAAARRAWLLAQQTQQ